MIPQDHKCYCEPCAGAAWVLFGKDRSDCEVINDADGDLINFFVILKKHLFPFMEYYKFAVVSRELWEKENRTDPTLLTDIERAARYYYLQRLAFGGKAAGRTFGTGTTQPPRLNLSNMEEVLLDVHARLQKVWIESMDVCRCIEHYDRPTTFFYIDPPYYGTSQSYAVKFAVADFARLRKTLDTIEGRFLLSLNDCPEVRDLFKGFRMKRVLLTYSTGNSRVSASTRSKPRAELLIRNY